MSVTTRLDSIKAKEEYFEGCLPEKGWKDFGQKRLVLSNPLPDFVNKTRSWALFGTFADYVIRKIILDNFQNKVKSSELICGMFINDDFLSEIQPSEPRYNQRLAVLDILKDSINKFNDPKTGWRLCINEIYRMSQFDVFYRRGIELFSRVSEIKTLNAPEKRDTQEFFEPVEKVITHNFKKFSSFHLNPTLGLFPIKADADLICDDVLYDIKCVKEPRRHFKDTYFQLLAYVPLIEARKSLLNSKNAIELPKNIMKIGIIFPQHLAITEIDISDWKSEDKMSYLKKLESVQAG